MKHLAKLLALLTVVGVLNFISLPPVHAAVEEGVCLQNSKLSCSAKEVPLLGPTVNILDGCDFPGDSATIELFFDADGNADRYDIGIWVSTDGDPNGDGSESGLCSVISLDTTVVDNLDNDACGDLDSSNVLTNINVGTITVLCNDTDNDGEINVPIIMAWDQNAGGVCTGPYDTKPGAPAKCVADLSYALPVPVPGQIIIQKETTPDGFVGEFDFVLGGDASDSFTLSDGESWESGVGGAPVLFSGTYTISETNLPAGWSLNTPIICDNGDFSQSAGGVTINLLGGETVTCTFVNDRDPFCGDGSVDAGEECDDGNTSDGDGCDALCVEEFCGDGIENNNGEACDDGNMISGDGCSDSCVVEFCGDGVTNNNGVETCDDGNTTNGDGCNSSCIVEFCGDGVTNNNGVETCDDGNTTNGDGCNSSCILEFCGDGITNNVDEECDDGKDGNATDGCNDQCEITTNGACSSTNGTTLYDFDNAGDSLVSSSTLCSEGTISAFVYSPDTHTWSWSCDGDGGSNASCQAFEAYCGDGQLEDGSEECDDGDNQDGDGCSALCVVEFCGDSIINNVSEVCDDGGNGDDSDGCNDLCEETVNGSCGSADGANYYGENTIDENTSSLCAIGTVGNFVGPDADGGYTWTCVGINGGANDTCTADEDRCGDDSVNLDNNETCDDGVLNGQPNQCNNSCNGTTSPTCGNGTIENGEVCDDGSDNSDTQADACRTDCTLPVCGDGVKDSTEACDDGADGDATDGCNDFCIITSNGQCGPVDGDNIYDFDNQGDGLVSSDADLCSVGTVSNFSYDGTTDTWSWDCNGDGGSDELGCTATEEYCGDGLTNGTEACDDGADGDATDGCNDLCEITTNGLCSNIDLTEIYDFDNGGDALTIESSLCDEGTAIDFVYDDENHVWTWSCDGDGGSDDTCTATELYCGDGLEQEKESCDDGADGDDTDGCNDRCEFTYNGICGSANLQTYYGQNTLSVESLGLCDESAVAEFVGPDADGVYTWICLGENGGADVECSANEERCGDGITNNQEICDDGDLNGLPNQCNNSCTAVTPASCGNGELEDGEQCDDGEGNSDTEANACRTDCSLPVCGDSVVDEGETCDDGNTNNGDRCSSSCQIERTPGGGGGGGGSNYCGDGIARNGEQCDDGNRVNGDGCDTSCRIESDPEPEPQPTPGGPELLDTGPTPSAIDQLRGVTLAQGEPQVILPPMLFDTGAEKGLTYLQWFKMLTLMLIGGIGLGSVMYRLKVKGPTA